MAKHTLGLLVLLTAAFAVELASDSSCPIDDNQEDLIFSAPTLLSSTANGQKLLYGSLDDPNKNYIYVANVKGTAYEMGVAYG